MTQKRIEEEREFESQCMLEKFGEMLESGEITQQRHDELAAKVKGV